jgi:hypothetical protein
MRIPKILVVLVCSMFLMQACNKSNTSVLKIDSIPVSAEGPYFVGPNTFQGEIQNQLEAFAKENGITVDQLKSAKLTQFSLRVSDSLNFDKMSSIKMQMVSEQTDMIEAASANSIEKGKLSINFAVSNAENDYLELLKQNMFTLVVDANMKEDIDNDIAMLANLEFEIKY